LFRTFLYYSPVRKRLSPIARRATGEARVRTRSTIFPQVLLTLFLLTVPASAQPPGAGFGDDKRVSLSVIPVSQLDTAVEGGGEYSFNGLLFRMDYDFPVRSATSFGVGVSYDLFDYRFSGSAGFAGLDPWGKVHGLNFSFPIRRFSREGWSFMAIPSVGVGMESGADWQEAMEYGAVVSTFKQFGEKLNLGFGVGAFYRLERTDVYPMIVVSWHITDRLTLGNPFRPGPAGPAGLELSYTINPKWEIAGGGAYRSNRFRLNDEGPAHGGIGEVVGLPVYSRLTWSPNRTTTLDLFAGAFLDGELTLEDRDDVQITSADTDTGALFGIGFSTKF